MHNSFRNDTKLEAAHWAARLSGMASFLFGRKPQPHMPEELIDAPQWLRDDLGICNCDLEPSGKSTHAIERDRCQARKYLWRL